MRISAIEGFSGFGSYRISSVHGNPYSLNAVQRIGQNNGRSGKPLVIASEEKEELYVKDYGELDAPTSTASGGFAEMLGIQERMFGQKSEGRPQTDYASYLNDTIGRMGLQNRLRDQLSGVGFTPFL